MNKQTHHKYYSTEILIMALSTLTKTNFVKCVTIWTNNNLFYKALIALSVSVPENLNSLPVNNMSEQEMFASGST